MDPLPSADHAVHDWTLAHDLALIYVTLAHRTDDALSRSEVEAILLKISDWMPGAGLDTLRAFLREVVAVYEQRPQSHTFADAVTAVRDRLPIHQRPAVLDDLRYIADADGVLLVEERVLIEVLARAWGVAGTDE